MPRRQRRKYTPEHEADAVRMVREVGNPAKVARDLDLTASGLRDWVKQAAVGAGEDPTGTLTTGIRLHVRG